LLYWCLHHLCGRDYGGQCGSARCHGSSAGSVDQPDAMGLRSDLQAHGYALLCVSYPRADLTLKTGQEDALYEAQFGQFQK